MAPKFWLLKSEPDTYSFSQLIKDKKTNWDHIRNYQARNYLREMKAGDLALIYHSGKEKSVMGIAEVVRESYPDPDPETPGEWLQVDLRACEALDKPVTLAEIKAEASLKELPLIRQSRLSVMPISAIEYKRILEIGKQSGAKG